jgi:hypothetical protein
MGRLYKMQVFSKLQRDSTYKTFIKIIFIFFINSLSALTPLFPIMIGFFLYCDEFFFSFFYLGFFSVFHNVNIFYLFGVYLIISLFLSKKIFDYINDEYQSIVYVLIVYIFLFIYYIKNVEFNELFIFLFFNFFFDILLIKVFKCEAKLL